MRKIVIILATIMAIIASTAAFSKPIKLRDGYPSSYTVQPGDTLWGIATKFLDDPLQWPTLYRANTAVIQNPNKIYPGEIIRVYHQNGKPYLRVTRGDVIKLSPSVRSVPIDHAIPAIPLDLIKPFLNDSRVVSENELERAPFIIGHVGEHIVAGAGDKVYVQELQEKFPGLTDFSILRKGRAYLDPHSKKILGYAGIDVGKASLLEPGDTSTLIVSSTRLEVLQGDRLLPVNIEYDPAFHPRIPDSLIQGDIIGVMGGVTQIGQYQVIVFDRGSSDGVKIGDLYAVFQKGKAIKNPVINSKSDHITLPNERAGEIMIFRTFPSVSYGLVMHATNPIHLLDIVTTPEN